MNITSILRECASDLLATEPHIGIEQVVSRAYQRHSEVFQDAQERMVLNAARRIVAGLMRDLTQDEAEQQVLEGMRGLPSAIAVKSDDGTYYVRSDKAVWHELLAGLDVRNDNVEAALASRDAYQETVETLRPHMEEHPDRPTYEAAEIMAEAA